VQNAQFDEASETFHKMCESESLDAVSVRLLLAFKHNLKPKVALNLFREMFKSNLQLFARRTSCMGYLGDQENHLL
jgi:hypothetical protein